MNDPRRVGRGILGRGNSVANPAHQPAWSVHRYLSDKYIRAVLVAGPRDFRRVSADISTISRATDMSVIKRGNSKYWYIQFRLNGNTYVKSTRTDNRRAAEQMERDWKADLHAQAFLGKRERIRLWEAINHFCDSRKSTPNHRNLMIQYRHIQRYLKLNRYLDELTSSDLDMIRRERLKEGAHPQSLTHTFNLLRGTWKFAKGLGYQVSDLVFPAVKVPKHRLRYLSVDEEKRLLKELDPKRDIDKIAPYGKRNPQMQRELQDAYDLIVILLDTGARHTEIATLEWSSINLDERTIRLWRPKVRNESVLYMSDRVYRILDRRHREIEGKYIFTNKVGNARGYAGQSISRAFKRAGLKDCSMHTLRHTHATRLIQNGLSVYEVKEILGHTDIKTTLRYAHLEMQDISSKARDVINDLNKESEKVDLKVVK